MCKIDEEETNLKRGRLFVALGNARNDETVEDSTGKFKEIHIVKFGDFPPYHPMDSYPF